MTDLEDRLDRVLGPIAAPPGLYRRLTLVPLEVPQRSSWWSRHVRGMAWGGGIASLVSCLLLGLWLGGSDVDVVATTALDEEIALAATFLGPDLVSEDDEP